MVSSNKKNHSGSDNDKKDPTSKSVKGNRKRAPDNVDDVDEENSKRIRLDGGTILTLGQGDMGQLGLGDEILSRKKPALVKDLADVKMTKIVSGALHTVCLSVDNQVYTFGCNDEYALGRESDEDENSEYLPQLVAGPLSSHKLHQVTAGDSHTMALTIDGKVFIWGMFRDSHGQMGMFKEKEPCRTPTHLSSLNEPVISIASGNDHIVLISNSGKVFTMGCSEQGQLGRVARYFADRVGQRRVDATKSLLRPLLVRMPARFKRMSSNQKVVRAFAGAFTSWVITDKDQVFAWGLNNWCQLGFPDDINRFRPEYAPLLSGMKIQHIDGGQHHSLILDKDGRVYSMGRGEYGRLGLGPDIKQANKPTRIEDLEDIASVSACSSVSFAVSNSGVGYGWGLGSNLQLSTGDEEDEWTPIKLTGRNLEAKKVLALSAGGQHTALLVTAEESNSATT